MLPKIHKRLSNVPGSPIISNCGTPTEKVSEFLDDKLKPEMQKSWSFIKDTNDFISKISRIHSIPKDALLVTVDVVGLYPSIPHKAGLEALEWALNKRSCPDVATEDLIEMAEFVLSNNYFEFSDSVKQQISGTAMGTKFAPAFACLFMDQVETNFLRGQDTQPLVWLRYIDDIFLIWTHGDEKLKLFLENLNNYHPNLEFTHNSSKHSVPFLDLEVTLSNSKIVTDLYIKTTDRHQYLHYESSHPNHTKRSIIYSQCLRISRICSYKKDFDRHMKELRLWFIRRGYPGQLIDSEMKKVKFSGANCNKDNINCKANKGVPLVITYHPKLKSINSVINKKLYLLQMDSEVKRVFAAKPMVSFRGARKVSSYLVRAKLYPLERTTGSLKCEGSRCDVCLNVNETSSFSSAVTNETFKINHKLSCKDKCLIYLLDCKKCKMQYIGQTVTNFRYRWNNYKCNNKKFERGDACMQQHIFEHFSSNDHTGFLEDVSITFIDKTDPSDPLKREDYWRSILKTLSPNGLNIEESV